MRSPDNLAGTSRRLGRRPIVAHLFLTPLLLFSLALTLSRCAPGELSPGESAAEVDGQMQRLEALLTEASDSELASLCRDYITLCESGLAICLAQHDSSAEFKVFCDNLQDRCNLTTDRFCRGFIKDTGVPALDSGVQSQPDSAPPPPATPDAGVSPDSSPPAKPDLKLSVDSFVPAPDQSVPVPDVSPPPTTTKASFYSATSPFNTPIPANQAVSTTDSLVDFLANESAGHDVVIAVDSWTVPVWNADSSTPKFDVKISTGWYGVSKMLSVPIPQSQTDLQDPAGDGHLVIIDSSTSCVFEFWQFKRTSAGTYQASWGQPVPGGLKGTGIYPGGGAATASGFSLLGGLILPEELAAGEIPHALTFSAPTGLISSKGPVAPATFSDGGHTGPFGVAPIPMGARLQLNPGFDVNAHTKDPYARTVLRALQKYGMYLRDSGGSGNRGDYGVYALSRARHPDRYKGISGLNSFHGVDVPWKNMRVLAHGPQDPSHQSSGVLDKTSSCAKMVSSSGAVMNQ